MKSDIIYMSVDSLLSSVKLYEVPQKSRPIRVTTTPKLKHNKNGLHFHYLETFKIYWLEWRYGEDAEGTLDTVTLINRCDHLYVSPALGKRRRTPSTVRTRARARCIPETDALRFLTRLRKQNAKHYSVLSAFISLCVLYVCKMQSIVITPSVS